MYKYGRILGVRMSSATHPDPENTTMLLLATVCAGFSPLAGKSLPILPAHRRPCLAFMGPVDDYEAELAKLKTTLSGLSEDGFPPEALAPLETKISVLEQRKVAASSLPPLSDAQSRVWSITDDISDAFTLAGEGDEFAGQRLATLKAERRFMLSALVQEGAEAYLAILEALQGRPDASNTLATDQDLPKLAGTVLDSAAAVEQALSAQAVAAAEAAEAARKAQALAAAAEQEAAAAEAANEAFADSTRSVDVVFARAFLTSEESRFGVAHKYVGKDMWSEAQDDARAQNFRDACEALTQGGGGLDAALMKVSRVDPVARQWVREAEAEAEAKVEAKAEAKAEAGAPVAIRLAAAWSERDAFVAEWQSRVPKSIETDALAVDDASQSAVGRIRQRGASSDPMSLRPGEKENSAIDNANQWWKDNMVDKWKK